MRRADENMRLRVLRCKMVPDLIMYLWHMHARYDFTDPIDKTLFIAPTGRRFGAAISTPGQWAISSNRLGREKKSIFGSIARAQRWLFCLFSQQGAQNGPPPPCYANRHPRCPGSLVAPGGVWILRTVVLNRTTHPSVLTVPALTCSSVG